MSKNYAVKHVGIGSKRFKPGEELPELTDAQWKHLLEVKAIRCEHDPIEAEMELADELNQQGEEPDDDLQEDVQDSEVAEKGEAVEEMPDINVMDGIDDETEKPKERGRKAGKA